MHGVASALARYAVVGNPVAHSLSPEIHAAFATQTGEAVAYTRVLAPLNGFVSTIERFFDEGGMGLSVTVPFKLEAFAYCGERGVHSLRARAQRAGAVNVLARRDDAIEGDNTDGVGLVTDLKRIARENSFALVDARVLLIGAGGAARGAIDPLLATRPAQLTIVNRDVSKALALVHAFDDANPHNVQLRAQSFDALDATRYDVLINATSASLANASLPLPPSIFAGASLAYDMMYGAAPTPFMVMAEHCGAATIADGLGMLVEQAAEAFAIWRGVRPQTAPVLKALHASLVSNSAA